MRLWTIPFLLVLAVAQAQEVKEGAPGDAQKLVTIQRIVVEGTRLRPLSVLRLAQLKAGDRVDFLKVYNSIRKVTQTGLIKQINFEYESVPDKDTTVILHLKCIDQDPSAKASIRLPNVSEEEVWKWLTDLDPMFTREMPPTETAVNFYSHMIGKYMETHGDPKFQENYAIVADATSSSSGSVVDRLVFTERKRMGVK